jgi:hypothetical protein
MSSKIFTLIFFAMVHNMRLPQCGMSWLALGTPISRLATVQKHKTPIRRLAFPGYPTRELKSESGRYPFPDSYLRTEKLE